LRGYVEKYKKDARKQKKIALSLRVLYSIVAAFLIGSSVYRLVVRDLGVVNIVLLALSIPLAVLSAAAIFSKRKTFNNIAPAFIGAANLCVALALGLK